MANNIRPFWLAQKKRKLRLQDNQQYLLWYISSSSKFPNYLHSDFSAGNGIVVLISEEQSSISEPGWAFHLSMKTLRQSQRSQFPHLLLKVCFLVGRRVPDIVERQICKAALVGIFLKWTKIFCQNLRYYVVNSRFVAIYTLCGHFFHFFVVNFHSRY